MIIKVLGPGCTNCKNLERVTREAVDALGIDATIEKVVVSGRVPKPAEVREMLAPATA